MSNTLLPCPFCGGEAKITARDVEPQGDPWYGKNIQTFVICTNCGACLFDDYFHEGFADEHEATTAWNRRAQPENKPLTNAQRIRGMSISVIIPNSVTTINNYAFSDCRSLASANIYTPAENLFICNRCGHEWQAEGKQ